MVSSFEDDTEAQVSDFDFAIIVHQDISRFEVSVNDELLVETLEAVEELFQEADSLRLRESLPLLETRFQIAALHVFFNQILIIIISEVVIILNYVGALNHLEGIDFVGYKLADDPV